MPGVQDGLKPSDFPDFSRVLSPNADANNIILQPTNQKRRHYEAENTSNIWEPFKIKQPNHDSITGSAIFSPRLLLPRSCLPLACLDIIESNDSGQKTRLFCAHVATLETASFDDSRHSSPHILIAERNDKSLYAIERVRPHLYVQCRLGSWVTLSQLEYSRVSDGCRAPPPKRLRLSDADYWWQGLFTHGKKARRPLREEQSLKARHRNSLDLGKPGYINRSSTPPILELPSISPVRPASAGLVVFDGTSHEESEKLPLIQPLQDPEDLLKTIKTQYMESLYRTKASLAYFAKGPLSRARAAFSDSNDAAASLHHLLDYLQTLIIPLNMLDKKYRETLPTLVTEFPASSLSDGERVEVAAQYQKDIRKSKKQKIGKNGLYPQEKVDILRWWLNQLESLPACDSAEFRAEAVKATLLEQRAREIYLQIILILEVLALESILPVPSIEKTLDEGDGDQHAQKKRAMKKPQDLCTLLDLSVDKLCIWQSMAVEENKSSEYSRETGATEGESLRIKKPDTNHLRDFCVDVILPFYAARLPEMSRMLCKKLGGPLSHSPARPAPRKAPSSLKPPKPGAAVKRSQPRQARRTLERVLTDEKTCRRPAPSLSRSVTDSVLPNLKREASDVSLSNVPLSRTTFHKSNRYSQREVDLTAVSQAAEVKAKKKANIEQELQGAIAALKKPNPRMAVKEFVEAAEQRAAGVKSRKRNILVRNPFAQGVQIMATPSANRRKDVFNGHQSQSQSQSAIPEELEEIPPSSCTHVPASTVKQRTDMVVGSAVRNVRQRLLPNVEETPTRGPSKHADLNVAADSAASVHMTSTIVMKVNASASMQDTSQRLGYRRPPYISDGQATPSRKASTNLKGPSPEPGVEVTPVKHLTSMSANIPRAHREIESPSASNEAGVSIYKSLGWDDDIDELM